MKNPWFRIIEIIEPRGRSMADIALSVATERRVALRELRSRTMRPRVQRARYEAFKLIRRERPDISSTVIGDYFRVEGSTVRRAWRTIDQGELEGFLG